MQDKVTFITKRTDHVITDSRIEIVQELTSLIEYLNYCKNEHKICGLDTENSSLNPLAAVPLLAQFGDSENVFVLDRTSFSLEFLRNYDTLYYIGQNLQYDYSIIKWNEGGEYIDLINLIDLMVAEQIVGRGSGRSNSLEAIHLRRLNKPYPMDKGIREEFIGMKKTAIFYDRHILYAGEDITCLHNIWDAQKIVREGLQLRIEEIGFPLIRILGDMCINGSAINKENWFAVYEDNKVKKLVIEQEMDRELISLGFPTKVRNRQDVTVIDLFGNTNQVSNMNIKNINYGGSKQVLRIFEFFKLPKPTAKDKKTHAVKVSMGGDALEQYLILYPNSKLKKFMHLLLEYASINKRMNSFGLNFISDIYPDPNKPNSKNNLIRGHFNTITNKVHTKYKGEFTANGRLSSGSDSKNAKGKQISKKKKSEVFFNSQNLPKENRYRNCFILEPELVAKGWWRTTLDLAGAELIILGAQSGDRKLLELQASDIHSHLATVSYTNIIKYILNNMGEVRSRMELYDLLRVNKTFEIITITNEKDEFIRFLTREEKDILTRQRVEYALRHRSFTVDKKGSKDIRDAFKNVVYGVAYGSQSSRVSETLNIAKDYAQIVLDSMFSELPIAMGYLERMSQFGVQNGYITFNNRTNSRHIFKSVLDANNYGRELNRTEVGTIERACKNYIISGTQADMIKESMVNIDIHLRDIKHPYKWVFQIHDELVIDHYGKEIVKDIGKITTDTCNKYLNGLAEMKCNIETLHYWTK